MKNDMTSEKQIRANQMNSLSGGVKTPSGKAISSKNALTHGILSNQVLENERSDFEHLFKLLVRDYQPKRVVEKVLVERIALHIIQLQRLNIASKEYWRSCIEPEIREPDPLKGFGLGKVVSEGYEPSISEEKIERLFSVYHRYQTRLENQLMKLDRELS